MYKRTLLMSLLFYGPPSLRGNSFMPLAFFPFYLGLYVPNQLLRYIVVQLHVLYL